MANTSKKQWPAITRENGNGTEKWRIDARYLMNGRTYGRRLWFNSQAEAKEAARLAQIARKNDGDRALSLTREQFADYDRATKILATHAVGLTEAAEYYAAHLAERSKLEARTVGEAIDEFLSNPAKRANGGDSYTHQADLKHRLNRFAIEFGERTIGDVATAELDNWLAQLTVTTPGLTMFEKPLAPQTRTNFRRVLGALFNFAKTRGYTASNPVEHTARPKPRDREVGILTVEQTLALLEAADPSIVPFIALGAFCGLRRAEIERIDWAEVDLAESLVEIKASNAKSARRRLVRISGNCAAWLAPYASKSGKLAPTAQAVRIRLQRARSEAGIVNWPPNALRHGFASYHLAKHRDAAALAGELGHTNSSLLFAHYRQLVKPAEAERYWEIMPSR